MFSDVLSSKLSILIPGGIKLSGILHPDLSKSFIIEGFHLSGIPCCFHEYTVFSFKTVFVNEERFLANSLPPPKSSIIFENLLS